MIYLVVDGGHQPSNNRAGAGAVLVETTGSHSDLLCLGTTEQIVAHRAWAFESLSSRIAETRAILQGIQWARETLGPSNGALLVFSDCHDAINRAWSTPGALPTTLVGTILTLLPPAMRGDKTPHRVCHWLATASIGHPNGEVARGEGCPTPAEIEALIDAGPDRIRSGRAAKLRRRRERPSAALPDQFHPATRPTQPTLRFHIDPATVAGQLAEIRRHDPPHLEDGLVHHYAALGRDLTGSEIPPASAMTWLTRAWWNVFSRAWAEVGLHAYYALWPRSCYRLPATVAAIASATPPTEGMQTHG